MHGRYYDYSMGRFLSVDPIITKGALRKPQLWNRYAYVANNTINAVDPDGRLLQLSGCRHDANSSACKSDYNLYLSTFGTQSKEAAKYLQIGKDGIVRFKGITGAAFASKFGTMGRASNYLISNRVATFTLTTDASRVAPGSGGASTRYGHVGAEIRDAFDAMLGASALTAREGYGTAFENQWRRENGLDQRLFYKYFYGDVRHTRQDVFEWPD